MKKYLIIASAALVALASCSKEQPAPVVNEDETVYLTFTSGRPQLATSNKDTKTEWNTNRVVWSSGDKIRVGYTKDGEWMGQSAPGTAKFYKSGDVSIDGGNASVGTFTVPISGSAFTDPAVSGTYQFFAVYPGDAISGTDVADPTSKNITLPAIQTPGSNTFDPTADILVGKTETLSIDGLPTDPIELHWTRLVAHADLTFSYLDFSGAESVSKITLTFNTEAKVAGSFAVNIPAGTAGEGSTNTLVLSGSNISSGANNAKAWACVLPVTFTSLDVELRTEKAVYTREITGISKTFKQNARNTLTINMSSATRTPITELVADGNYVIAAESSDTYYAISSEANGDRRARSEITTVGFAPGNYSVGSPYTAANNLVWTVTNVAGGIKINQATDPSSYMAYKSNGISLNSTGSVITVENGSSAGTYKLNSTSYMQMNGTNGFGFYASNVGTKDFYFIPATGTPTLTFPIISKTVDAETTSVVFSYTSAFLSDTPVVSITSDTGSAVADTDIAAGTLTVTLNENTTASNKNVTLTVSATGATPVVLTITQVGAVGDANNGDILWAEDFGGFSANDVPATSNASTEVYGSKTVTYSVGDGGGTTKVYAATMAGGSSPELLIAKNSGYLTATDIPTGSATGMTLSFKANNDNVVVSSTTVGATISYIGKSGSTYTYSVTVPNATKVLNLTFTNDAGVDTNIRIDDILLVAGAPIPGITVATSAATATSTAAGTTATLNGSLALVNGALNANVTSAGFYYKVNGSGGAYSKVTCAVAPTSTTNFSYDLTGLSTGTTYTYYAWAVYDSGSEVTGEATETTFTPTQSGGGPSTTTITYEQFENTSYNTSENTFSLDAISYGYVNAMRNGSNGTPSGWARYQVIQTKSGSSVYNKTSMGSITNIRVYTVANTNSFTVTTGSSSEPTTNSVTRPATPTGSESITYTKYENKTTTPGQTTTANYYDFAVENQPYFKIAPGGSLYIFKIVITYSN